MIQATASVQTANAAKSVMGLLRSWGDRIEINFRERQGVVHLGSASATLSPTDDRLVVTILATDSGAGERLRSVLSQRAGRLLKNNGPLKFDWQSLSDLEVGAL